MIGWIRHNPTLAVALYGAFLSTIAIIWNIYNSYQDRPFDFAWYRDETGKLYKSKSIKNKLNNYFKS